MVLFEADNLRFQYENPDEPPKTVLRDVDLTIERGEFVALLGHNGCGKSTLAKHFNALLLPTGGTLLVEGMNTADEELTMDIRRKVGLVLQNPDNQLVSTVVEEDVAFAPENLGFPSEEIRKRVDNALKIVGMDGFKLHAPHLLSGGQKQRIAIAGVLAMNPECVVFDEATAMLDPKGRQDVMDIIKLLRDRLGTTVVLITHHMKEAAQADRVLVLSDGRIVMDGAPKEVFSQVEKLRELELDIPSGTNLIYELNKAGFDIPLTNLSIDECAGAIYASFMKKD